VPEVVAFIGTEAYEVRKAQRFRSGDELVIERNPAFTLHDPNQRNRFKVEYAKTAALYYNGQPSFEEILSRISQHIHKL